MDTCLGRQELGGGDIERDLDRIVLDRLPVLVAYLDGDHRYRLANQTYATFFGRSPAEMVGVHIAEMIGTDLYPTVLPHIEAALAGRPQEFETPVTTPHGPRYVRVHYLPDRHKGVIRGVVIQVHDITERRRATVALARAEERFRILFEAAPTATLLNNEDGVIVAANAAALELLRYGEGELVGLHASTVIHPDEHASAGEILRMLYEEHAPKYSGERRYVCGDGTVIWAQADITVISGSDDSEDHYLLAQLQDIGARKRYQAQLEFLADHDSLTGLLNRRGFKTSLEAQAAENRTSNTETVVLVLDLDGFKAVNDEGGHDAGDNLLVEVANVLRSTLGTGSTIARLGGDEFAMLLPGPLSDATHLAGSAVVAAVNRTTSAHQDRPTHQITASAGIAAFAGEMTGDEALIAADQAMYRAKNAGRNRLSL